MWSNASGDVSEPTDVQAVIYNGASGTPVFTAEGSSNGSFGNLGDVNGDGFADIAHGLGSSTYGPAGRVFDRVRRIERTPANGRSIVTVARAPPASRSKIATLTDPLVARKSLTHLGLRGEPPALAPVYAVRRIPMSSA